MPTTMPTRTVSTVSRISRGTAVPRPSPKTQEERPKLLQFKYPGKGAATRSPLLPGGGALAFLMADPASGRCWLFYYPSLTSLLVLLRPVDKPNFNILDPQGPVPRKHSASGD